MEQKVYKRQPKTVEELERAILEEWEKIDQDTIDNCINHSIRLIPLIVTAKGEYVESKRGYRH